MYSLSLSLNLTTLQSVVNGWCFNLGLSLTKRLSPEMLKKKLFIVKLMCIIYSDNVQFKRKDLKKKNKVSEPRLNGEHVTGSWIGNVS